MCWVPVGPAGGPERAGRRRANPGVAPGGRDGELSDPVESGFAGQRLALGVQVVETVAGFAAADAGIEVADIGQARGLDVPLRDGLFRQVPGHDAPPQAAPTWYARARFLERPSP